MKYIMTEEGPIIFPVIMKHSDVTRKINKPITSAGFCDVSCNKVFGYSKSLELSHKPDDLEYIQFHASLK